MEDDICQSEMIESTLDQALYFTESDLPINNAMHFIWMSKYFSLLGKKKMELLYLELAFSLIPSVMCDGFGRPIIDIALSEVNFQS